MRKVHVFVLPSRFWIGKNRYGLPLVKIGRFSLHQDGASWAFGVSYDWCGALCIDFFWWVLRVLPHGGEK